jgi:DNA-directed RNA polymerase subunit A'
MRPSVRFDTGQRSEDDLTHQLSNIIKANKLLADKIKRVEEGGAGTSSREEINRRLHSLQHALFVYVDNNNPNIPSVKQRMGGRPLKTLLERLKGKEGRFRNHLMGKRVDFSARSVITPDPNIGINELGVPYKIAMNLTVPETVNKYNIEELDKYVKNGPNIYPGAKYVKHTDKNITVIIREKNQRKLEIAIGDVVYRHMKNGDVVLFNRQPSLHRMSMMAHKARIMDYNTFRLNVCVTPCYNADFDG